MRSLLSTELKDPILLYDLFFKQEISIQNRHSGDREMVQWERILAVNHEDLSLNPSVHIKSRSQLHKCLNPRAMWGRDRKVAGAYG